MTALEQRLRGALAQPVRRHEGVLSLPAVTGLADLSMLGGTWFDGPQGPGYVVESRYDAGYLHGAVALYRALNARTAELAGQGGDPRLAGCPTNGLLFIDTETTGMGGAGSMVFLAGAAQFRQGTLILRQYLLPRPEHEPAMLGGLANDLETAAALVSYNGKSFDVPALETRAVLARTPLGLRAKPHLDLLHPNRRLFKGRLASHRLIDVEVELLGFEREDDCPSAEAPVRYFQFQRSGDPTYIAPVLRHNAWDILSLVALYARMAEACSTEDEPLQAARAADYAGDVDAARSAYERALESGPLSRAERLEAMERLARCAWRQGDAAEAARWWKALIAAPGSRRLTPYVELAKLQEHRFRDPGAALETVEAALGLIERGLLRPGPANAEAGVPALERRHLRLQSRAARTATG